MTPPNLFAGIHAPCCWDGTQDVGMPCACGPEERVLRAYIDGLPNLPPMTAEQKYWCLDEIGSVEGYDRLDYDSIKIRTWLVLFSVHGLTTAEIRGCYDTR